MLRISISPFSPRPSCTWRITRCSRHMADTKQLPMPRSAFLADALQNAQVQSAEFAIRNGAADRPVDSSHLRGSVREGVNNFAPPRYCGVSAGYDGYYNRCIKVPANHGNYSSNRALAVLIVANGRERARERAPRYLSRRIIIRRRT